MTPTQRAPLFLADKSALARSHHQSVAQRLAPLFPSALVATCPIIDLELLFSVRNHTDFDTIAKTTGQPTQWIAPRGTL